MKLATLDDGTRDGTLVVVRHDGAQVADATAIARTLQTALDDWARCEPALRALAAQLDRGEIAGRELDPAKLRSPLPRAYEWIDGSAYVNHVVLVRKARGATPPATLYTDPLVYQGGSGVLLAPHEDVGLRDPAVGLDFEAEIVAILGDVPEGTPAADAARHVVLLTQANDCTLRNLIPAELAKGFGFFVSKPATAFGPFAVTPDELGDAWRDGRLHAEMRVTLNHEVVGTCNSGPEMHFSFHDLLAHVTRTRALTAGTLLGSGTVSNADEARGISCLAERRMREIIATGEPSTRFLQAGDVVRIEVVLPDGTRPFGVIEQRVVGC